MILGTGMAFLHMDLDTLAWAPDIVDDFALPRSLLPSSARLQAAIRATRPATGWDRG